VSKILVPVDFSDGSKLALRYAAPLAARLHATLTLLYVEPPPFLAGDLRENPLVLPDAEVDAALTRDLLKLAAHEIGPAFPVETAVRRGHAGSAIVETAQVLHSDLILMPTHAYTGLKHALYGSTAEHVMRHAERPVCAIRNELLAQDAAAPALDRNWQNLLVPVDFSERSREAVHFAGTLARQTGGRLTLFHVVELSALHVTAAAPHLRLAQAQHRADAEEKLDAWAREHVPPSVSVKTRVRVGAPSLELIARGIRRLGSDFIVMGTHEYSWLRRLVEGGGTERMLRLAPCPVISVRSPANAKGETQG